jgi:selenocysteine-specific elongation factor
MRSIILGTAGHIDHGKTALVRALTGTDTDRLAEEKARGITIDLGFAELVGEGIRVGVVDVPGHEGFVRNMLAGATGMDLALLVVAGDEGVMPQTREHLSILSLLGVSRLVVAITKIDLVDEDWLDLVQEEVEEVVGVAGFHEVAFARVSSRSGAGIDALQGLLLRLAGEIPERPDDVFALPIDRVFTIRGTGTVVTGTVTSGRVAVGERLRLLPSGVEARVRGLQVHGGAVNEASAGSRAAVALSGEAVDRSSVVRGEVAVTDPAWRASGMLTVAFEVLPDTGWSIRHNQRVRVHLGTAEVMARCVVFSAGDDASELPPGGRGWGQLRLESPVVARTGQQGVVRSYSPMTTIAGIRIVEPIARKRPPRTDPTACGFDRVLSGEPASVVEALLEFAGPTGVPDALLPVVTGCSPREVEGYRGAFLDGGGGITVSGDWVSAGVVRAQSQRLLAEVDRIHRDQPYRPGVAIEALRGLVPAASAAGLADLVLSRLEDRDEIVVGHGRVRRSGFEARFNPGQCALRDDLRERIEAAGLAPPFLSETPSEARSDPAFEFILASLVDQGHVIALDQDLYISRLVLDGAVEAVRATLGGREGLGPADFREALPVTRRHLLPILAWLDQQGVTDRRDDGRAVPI